MIALLSLSQTSNKNTRNNAHNLQSTAGYQVRGVILNSLHFSLK